MLIYMADVHWFDNQIDEYELTKMRTSGLEYELTENLYKQVIYRPI